MFTELQWWDRTAVLTTTMDGQSLSGAICAIENQPTSASGIPDTELFGTVFKFIGEKSFHIFYIDEHKTSKLRYLQHVQPSKESLKTCALVLLSCPDSPIGRVPACVANLMWCTELQWWEAPS